MDSFEPTVRVRIPITEDQSPDDSGYIGFDMPANSTAEDIEAAVADARKVSEQIDAFNARPETEKMRYYLALATKALRKIMDESHLDLKDDYLSIPPKYRAMISSACCTADMALIQIPAQYHTTEITV